MALDHGSKTIGVAISDVQRRLARPVETILRGKFSQDAGRIKALIKQHQPVAIIVGYPLHMDGAIGARCQSVRAFVRNLQDHEAVSLPVLLWDERLSSAAAQEKLRDAGLKAARRTSKIDAAAAALILENLLAHRARGND